MAEARLAGRRILVTGAASGMGRAIAQLFAAEGARLGLIDRDPAGLSDIARETGQLALPADLTDEPSVKEAVEKAAAELGGLDGLVNAAGILREQPFEVTTTQIFDDLVAVNLRGPFLVASHALAELRKAPAATIVNIASNVALNPHPGLAAYSATKAGLTALSQAMSKELGPTIRVNVVCPGIIRTPMTASMWEQGGMGDQAVEATIALKRPGRPEEVAETCLFLTSDASSFVSGAVVTVNGGALF
jgi:NAD(P)-dependent dehydrogenase (short-subunit alcohol dehydrogenase family)